MDTNQPPVPGSKHDDEINLLEYAFVSVKNKWPLIARGLNADICREKYIKPRINILNKVMYVS